MASRLPFAVALALVLALSSRSAPACAQTRPAFFDEPCAVSTVGEPAPGQRYPLFLVLPPTGLPAAWLLDALREAIPVPTYFVMLAPGAPARSDYLPRFGQYLEWVDARVLPDVAAALGALPIDRERVYAVGFSLGGDVSWALLVRHPEVFAGALVMGSRSTAGAARGAGATLRRRHARVAFAIGDDDEPGRRRGIARAESWTRRAAVPSALFRFDGGHQLPPRDVLARATRFMLEASSPP